MRRGLTVPVDEAFRLKLVEAIEPIELARPERRGRRSRVQTSVRSVVAALRATPGSADVIEQVPALANAAGWQEVAYFSVCRKEGSALFLDIWDADHFDGFTDMQRCLADCHAWFSATGYGAWGSAETKTGRVNCFFDAPVDGSDVCNARLQSFPSTSGAVVECLIDNRSFGRVRLRARSINPTPARCRRGFTTSASARALVRSSS
jgi:hypothetical protein